MIPNNEKLKKTLECCANVKCAACEYCPYSSGKCPKKANNTPQLLIDTLAYINQLEDEMSRLNVQRVIDSFAEVCIDDKKETADKDGKIDKHKELCTYLHSTYKSKNADYGDSFAAMFDEFGIITAITRIGDKFNRLKNLYKNKEQKVKDESVRDTLLDMANYCLMTVAEIDNSKNKTEVKK